MRTKYRSHASWVTRVSRMIIIALSMIGVPLFAWHIFMAAFTGVIVAMHRRGPDEMIAASEHPWRFAAWLLFYFAAIGTFGIALIVKLREARRSI